MTISTLKQQPSAVEIKDLVLQSLDDDKGLDITQIPLEGKSSIADYMIIASGSSGRQISAMCDHVEEKLKKAGAKSLAEKARIKVIGLSLMLLMLLFISSDLKCATSTALRKCGLKNLLMK